ncbi:protein HEG homolog 1-like [Osmerus mordax]|uniref:protein HEG homolog 1-like n=1 Tax=Osmerus mordax TaxID=8014 RepID=UPI00350F4D4C
MEDKASKLFQEKADKIINAMRKILGSDVDGYLQSTVLELREADVKTFQSRASKIDATVENLYKSRVNISEAGVTKKIEDALQSCQHTTCIDNVFVNAIYTDTNLCSLKVCHTESTSCKAADGVFECQCKTGYINTGHSNRICTACPSGKKAEDNGCVKCSFGLSGFNCNERWQLTLVIVGSVLGGVLLITLIVLSTMAFKPSKEKSENNIYERSYPTKAPATNVGMTTFQANANTRVPQIPRAKANNSWNHGSNLEMTESGSQHALIIRDKVNQDPDEMRNPYNRNPYNQNQGQPNLYYMHDNP